MISRVAAWLATPVGFLATALSIVAGGGVGALTRYSDAWLLAFNLFLSVAALLIGGLILVAGARDTAAVQRKLDELIRALPGARNEMIRLEEKTDEQVAALTALP